MALFSAVLLRDPLHTVFQGIFSDLLTYVGSINVGAAEMNPSPNARVFDALCNLGKALKISCNLQIRIGDCNCYSVGAEEVA